MNLDECARNVLAHNECTTDNTLPVTLEAIANIEKHPKPDEVNDIDLKVLYQFLANITAGYPIDDLENGATKDFLKQCFSVRINCNLFAESLNKTVTIETEHLFHRNCSMMLRKWMQSRCKTF